METRKRIVDRIHLRVFGIPSIEGTDHTSQYAEAVADDWLDVTDSLGGALVLDILLECGEIERVSNVPTPATGPVYKLKDPGASGWS